MSIEERKNVILDKIEVLKTSSIPVSDLEAAYQEGVASA